MRIPVRLPVPAPAWGGLLFVLFALMTDGSARAQCSYTTLASDTPQSFASTPSFPRFNQTAAGWAAVGARSAGTSNWDIGLSLGTAAFPNCVTLPVVASQQASGIDFVLGDFASEGTGLRYAPILRAGGTGSATVEWDAGLRTVNLLGYNDGPATPTLLDCWTANLVAGSSYQIRLFGDVPGDYTLYAFRRGGANTWRQRSDALVVVSSNYSSTPTLHATTTDRYAFVIVNETGTTAPYMFQVQACTDPPDLVDRVSQAIPYGPQFYVSPFEFTPAAPGFPTVAVRAGQDNGNLDIEIDQKDGADFYPCAGSYQASAGDYGPRVDLILGDFASGAITPGLTYAAGVSGGASSFPNGRIEYDAGTDSLVVDGATRVIVGGPDLVVRTFRVSLEAGIPYSVHIGKSGPATGHFYIFRPFDPTFPFGNGWSTLTPTHPPLMKVNVDGINDVGLTPPVTGPYAIVLTNESAENACWELGVSHCQTRWPLLDGVSYDLFVDALGPTYSHSFGAVDVRSGWSALAARGRVPGEDWVLDAWEHPTGGAGSPPNGCASGLLGTSIDPAVSSNVDFLARYDWTFGDLASRVQTDRLRFGGGVPTGGVQVEYEMWNNTLAVDDIIQNWPMTADELIEVWNVQLTAGQPYAFHFSAQGFAGELFLMKSTPNCNPTCMPEIVPMGGLGQEFRTSQDLVYTPAVDGVYGLIVVSQDGGVGSFNLGLSLTTVGTETPGRVVTTRLRAAAPSPTTGSARFLFDLARPARVGFDLVDLAGRVVARVGEAPFAAGHAHVGWGGTDEGGRRLAAGVYFVRMRVDGALVGAPVKLTIL